MTQDTNDSLPVEDPERTAVEVSAILERGRILCAGGAALAAGSLIALFAWSAYGPQGVWQDVVLFPGVLVCALGVTLFGQGLKRAFMGPYADLLPM